MRRAQPDRLVATGASLGTWGKGFMYAKDLENFRRKCLHSVWREFLRMLVLS